MAFDGKKYEDPAYTLPTYYHPGSPFQSQALSNCLVNSYYAAQQNSRLVFQQVYGANLNSTPEDQKLFTLESGSGYSGGAYHTIGKAYVYLPSNITNLVARSVFSAWVGKRIKHRLTVTPDAGAVLTSETIDVNDLTNVIPPFSRTPIRRLGYNPALNFGSSQHLPTKERVIDVAVEVAGTPKTTLDQRCTVLLEAACYSDVVGSLGTIWATGFYRPFFVSCYFEVRPQ